MTPAVDYRKFRLNRLNEPEFSHVKLLAFWPLFGLAFFFVERFYPVSHYAAMHCALDDLIPFNEWFLIPYLFWFVYLIGSLAYTFFFNTSSFRREMHFIVFTYSVTILLYLIFPTCQLLRPAVLPRDNALTRFIAFYYAFDTNTNVCPSLHVIGSIAALIGLWDAPRFATRKNRVISILIAFLISVSTVFVKQHSVLDVLFALPLCAMGFLLCRRLANAKTAQSVPAADAE